MSTSGKENAVADTWTVLRLIEWTTGFLSDRGSASARLDAEVLLSKALDCSRIDLYTSYDQVATDAQRDAFRGLVKERAAGVPVAYLVGEREFYSRMFTIDRSVLVPRPETEFVILEMLDRLNECPQDAPVIVDVGTGSGVLAITAALEVNGSRIWALDVSQEALRVARVNVTNHGLSETVELATSDLLTQLPRDVAPDVIISNPPYVSEAEWETLDPTVRNHEPRMALVGGIEGTEVISKLVNQAADRLAPGGFLICELSPMIATRVLEIVVETSAFQTPRLRNDLSKQARVISCRRA